MTTLSQLAKTLIESSNLWSRQDLDFELKPDGSPVSSVDVALNEVITDYLNARFPGIWIVSEEDPLSFDVPQADKVAQVDPLDGTENFVSGLPIWGVSVAVWISGFHHCSMLAFPELGLSLTTSQVTRQYTSRLIGHPSSSPMASLVAKENIRENRILGSAAFNLYCVVTGRFARFSNYTGAHSWDIVAGLNLAREHGCGVTVDGQAYRGEFLDPSRKYSFEVWR